MDRYEFLNYADILEKATKLIRDTSETNTLARRNKLAISRVLGRIIFQKFYPDIDISSRTTLGILEDIRLIQGLGVRDLIEEDLENGVLNGYIYWIMLSIRPYTTKGEPHKTKVNEYHMTIKGEIEYGYTLGVQEK